MLSFTWQFYQMIIYHHPFFIYSFAKMTKKNKLDISGVASLVFLFTTRSDTVKMEGFGLIFHPS